MTENQCDGCKAGMRVFESAYAGGRDMHISPETGLPYMMCQKDRYTDAKAKGESK
jgi:hypothetical protein